MQALNLNFRPDVNVSVPALLAGGHNNLPVPQTRLSVLEARIRAGLVGIGTSFSEALAHGIAVGCALKEAKALVRAKRERWKDWLAREFTLTPRSAQIYMALASNKTALEAAQEEKRSGASLLSIRDALTLIRTGKLKDGKPKTHKTRTDKKTGGSGSPLQFTSWTAASPDERRAFVASIPVDQLFDAFSQDQRRKIEQRARDERPKAAAPVMPVMPLTTTAIKKLRRAA